MATRILNFQSYPHLAISLNDTTPDPGDSGVIAWSTVLDQLVVWNGSSWGTLSTSQTAGQDGLTTFTWSSGKLVRVDYPNTNYLILTWSADILQEITLHNGSTTKQMDLTWSNNLLVSINTTTV